MSGTRRRMLLALVVLGLAWPMTGQRPARRDGQRVAGLQRGEPASTGYSPLDQIKRDNVEEPAGGVDLEVRQLRQRRQRDGDHRDDAADGERRPLLHGRRAPHRRGGATPAPARRCGPGGPTRARASTTRRARCIAASPTGPTARTSASSSSRRASSSSRSTRRPACPVADVRPERHRRSVQATRPRHQARSHGQDRQQLAAGHLERRDRRRPGADAGRPREHREHQGRHHGLRRAHREEAVDVPHDPARRANPAPRRGWATRAQYTGNAGIWGPFSRGPGAGYVYLSVESATNDIYGGHRPGQQPLLGLAGLPRHQDRQDDLVPAAGASRHLGLRHAAGARS